jgi:hypothetical protein
MVNKQKAIERFPRRTRDFTETERMPFYVVGRKMLMRSMPQDVEGLTVRTMKNGSKRQYRLVS